MPNLLARRRRFRILCHVFEDRPSSTSLDEHTPRARRHSHLWPLQQHYRKSRRKRHVSSRSQNPNRSKLPQHVGSSGTSPAKGPRYPSRRVFRSRSPCPRIAEVACRDRRLNLGCASMRSSNIRLCDSRGVISARRKCGGCRKCGVPVSATCSGWKRADSRLWRCLPCEVLGEAAQVVFGQSRGFGR